MTGMACTQQQPCTAYDVCDSQTGSFVATQQHRLSTVGDAAQQLLEKEGRCGNAVQQLLHLSQHSQLQGSRPCRHAAALLTTAARPPVASPSSKGC